MRINMFSSKTPKTAESESEFIVGPGAKPGTIPSDFEHAVGVERLELLGKLAGRSIFSSSSPETQNFSVKGTAAAPVLVESVFDAASVEKERIVGCSGHPKGSHEINFFWVRSEKESTRCPECGQAFKLQLLA